MLVKTGPPTLPPPPKVEGTLARLDDVERGATPTGYILTGWNDGVVDARVLAPAAKVVIEAAQYRHMSPFRQRLARMFMRERENKSKREIAEFLDKVNRKTREARGRRS